MQTLEQLAAADRYRSALDFTRAAIFVMKAGGSMSQAAALAAQNRAGTRIVGALKAAVSAARLSSEEDDFNILTAGFINSLATSGAFDACLAAGAVRLPITAPHFSVATGILGDPAAGEAQATPLRALHLSPGAMQTAWSSAIIVATNELLQSGSPGLTSLIAGELRRGVISSVDVGFLAALADGAQTVAAGPTIAESIAAGADLMTIDASARLILIAPTAEVRGAALAQDGDGNRISPELNINGGTIAGVRVVASDNLPATGSPGGDAILVDASQLAMASGELEMDRATHASLQMDSEPTMSGAEAGSPSAPTATSVVNLWQSNSVGIRVRRRTGYAKLRTGAAVVLLSAAW